jgi:RecG-like helicase
VALISTIHSIKKENIQVSIMAPTEILARQHFNSMQNFLFEY